MLKRISEKIIKEFYARDRAAGAEDFAPASSSSSTQKK
jgi:hypothetical protein